MAKSYAYVGAPSFIGAVEGRLADAGFSRVSDVGLGGHRGDVRATSGSALEDLYFGDETVTTAPPGIHAGGLVGRHAELRP